MDISNIKNIIEAALLASPHPLGVPQITALFNDEDGVGHDDVAQALDALREACTDRGVELVEVSSGFRYQVRQDVQPWVARMWTERPSRYSRALLETLALIAYRQPITRGEIEQIRGVVVSSNIIKTLEEREWIRVVGHRDAPGKPALFGTTRGFLDYFNLKSLDELPPLAEIRDFEDAEPQLDFDGDGVAVASVAMAEPLDDDGDAAASDAPSSAPPDDLTASADEENGTGNQTAASDAAIDPSTAAEAETPADADDAPARQDIQENRA